MSEILSGDGYVYRGVGHPADLLIRRDEPFRARVAALLERIEWAGPPDHSGSSKCPACVSPGELGAAMAKHAADCELAALLREAQA